MDSELYIDLLLYAVYLFVALAFAATLFSVWRSLSLHERSESELTPMLARHTGLLTVLLVVVVMVTTFLLGSTAPVASNGESFTDPFWLRLTDMFINTSILLIVLCSVIALATKFRR